MTRRSYSRPGRWSSRIVRRFSDQADRRVLLFRRFPDCSHETARAGARHHYPSGAGRCTSLAQRPRAVVGVLGSRPPVLPLSPRSRRASGHKRRASARERSTNPVAWSRRSRRLFQDFILIAGNVSFKTRQTFARARGGLSLAAQPVCWAWLHRRPGGGSMNTPSLLTADHPPEGIARRNREVVLAGTQPGLRGAEVPVKPRGRRAGLTVVIFGPARAGRDPPDRPSAGPVTIAEGATLRPLRTTVA